MAEYIDRERARATVCSLCRWEGTDNCSECEHPIDDIPAADVRPVVTCADCKYNKREVTDLWGNDAIQCITGQTHRQDWFCADGKKREES